MKPGKEHRRDKGQELMSRDKGEKEDPVCIGTKT
jgi:hypothetical protein